MVTSKSIIVPLIGCVLFLTSCIQMPSDTDENFVFVNFEKPYINEELRRISIDFISSHQIDNSIIEVTIEKKELEGVYVIMSCRGTIYFEAMKMKPMFTYEINNNSFFVFTGAETLFDSTYNQIRFQSRRKEKCEESFKTCYWFRNAKFYKEAICTYPDPFSDLRMSAPPPR